MSSRPRSRDSAAAALSVLLLVVLAVPAGRAAEPASPPLTVTATRQETSLADLPGNTAVVTRADLRQVRHQHVSQVLFRAPGTWISRGSGQEHLTAIRSPVLTGPGACGAFLFLEDGIPIRPTGFCNVNELFELNTEQATAIEVVRGPGGPLYGSNALHGLINVLSPRVDSNATVLTAESGSDDYYRGSFSTGRWDGRQGFRIAGHAEHDGGFRDDSGYDQGKLNLAWRHAVAGRVVDLRLSATRLQQETAGFIIGEDAYKDDDLRRSNPNPEAYRDADSLRVSATIGQALGDRVWLDLRPYARYSDMEFLQHFLPGQPLEKNDQTSAGMLTALFLDEGPRQWIFGADVEIAAGHLEEFQAAPIRDGSEFLQETRPAGQHYDYDVDSLLWATHVRVEQPLTDDTRLTAGVRYERLAYDYDNGMLDGNTRDDGSECGFGGCLFNRPADRSDTFSAWAPQLGLVHDLGPAQQIYLSASRGFRAPQATELYRLQRQQSVADLDTEELDAVEAGYRYAGDRGAAELTAFYMEKDNFIFRDAEGFNRSDGETRHLGLEYSLRWRLAPRLQLAADGTFARHTYRFSSAAGGGEIIESGDDVDTAPRRFSSVRIGWQPRAAARVELEWLSLGSYELDAANTDRYPGHDLFNLSWRQPLGKAWELGLRVDNLTDTSYAERADLAFGNYRYLPGRDRSVFAEFRWTTSGD